MRLRVQVQKDVFINYPTDAAPEDFQNFISSFLEWQCIRIKERVREVVKLQDYKWAPLSPNYVEFKNRMGLSPKTWFASGQVMDSIIYWYDALGDQWLIGFHPTLRHRGYKKGGGLDWSKKGARIIDIVKWVELGTTKMPARPLFTKVLAEFNKPARQKKLYAEYIQQQKGLL